MSAAVSLVRQEIALIDQRIRLLGNDIELLDHEIPSEYDRLLRGADEIKLLESRRDLLKLQLAHGPAATPAPELEIIPAQPRSHRIRRKHLTLIHSKA